MIAANPLPPAPPADHLTYLEDSLRQWQVRPIDAKVYAQLSYHGSNVLFGIIYDNWTGANQERARSALQRFATICAQQKQSAHMLSTKPLMQTLDRMGWWREWAADTDQRYVLAQLILTTTRDADGNLIGPAARILRQWCREQQAQHPQLRDMLQTWTSAVDTLVPLLDNPVYSPQEAAALLFGPTWCALFDTDCLTDPVALAEHLFNVRPQFAWEYAPAAVSLQVPLPSDTLE